MPLKHAYCLIVLCFGCIVHAQNPQSNDEGIRVMFYNVENLFHPSNDSLKNDDEFTPEGLKYWSYYRYIKKLNNIAKNVIAVGEWSPPAIVGLCEIEDIQCLNDLIYKTPLKTFGYKIIHQESKDKRGIDVALLYRPEYIKIDSFNSFELKFPSDSRPSRDILYIKGLCHKDTLHCFVNHWPSRYGGQLATESKRNYAASILKSKFDSIQKQNSKAFILAMGDFNDYPDDNSLKNILKAQKDTNNLSALDLINLMIQFENILGTNKYQHQWHILDQFIINPSLLKHNSLNTQFNLVKIFRPSWLLIDEKDGFGKKPFRTYNGYKYIDGFSDHLPIYLDIIYDK